MRMRPRVNKWLKTVQSVCYPSRCLLCDGLGVNGRDICDSCLGELPHNLSACRLCGLPLGSREDGVCGVCLKRSPPLHGSIIPFCYAAPLDHLLLGLKFNQQLLNARLLGSLMADAIAERVDVLPDCMLPVPLHESRLRERGYNQALELARPVAARLGLPLETGLVERVKATEAQSSLDRALRRRNIRGAFSVAEGLPGHVAIIDDVVTTGSTVNELAHALRRAGVERVVVWACARVP